MGKINLPNGAATILSQLRLNGFDTYVVGGYVRDSLLGINPHDWDICTEATPEQVKEVFAGEHCRIIETGIKHGTVTLVMDDGQYEVTTFRTDGAYSDHRRPDDVHFVRNIEADLSRRDFTINALAYDGEKLLDLFHGQCHLQEKTISCVGRAIDRFQEDALRILRALRFASVYGFTIAEDTAKAIHKGKGLLSYVAAERINTELCKLLRGKGVLRILLEYSDVLATVIPELGSCIGFEQNNRYHQYTIYDHIAHAVSNCQTDDLSVRIALLLHDIGKPLCYTEDENGGHFYGHGVLSHNIAERVLTRLKFDNKTKAEVLELVLYHDAVIEPTPKTVRRWLNKIGEQRFSQLLFVREANIRAHADGTQESRLERCHMLHTIMAQVLEEQQCFSIKNMEISGKDIINLGVPQSPRVGDILNVLLEKVITGEIPNDRDALLKEAVGLV